ncbi:phenylacetate-CoA oxygenase subunit PaaC [Flavobacteriales bacterium]|jgi:ring-1,2-phenylacetyl-CoA epoxidase subunit PaaC|nr:phenylacetate-CoA oxygenase subunit PaaC [Flavobacteriales bacterium]|tara:strand:+ start:29 stop:775 length:747 start_codon:yes stop_codon:yes gene_type:complete
MTDIEKYILRIADTTLILSQRLSEWCSKGPSLEEDIALSNISLDLLGQANGLLEYVSKLNGEISPDEYAFKRDEREFYNFQICEIENGHFGDTIMRQFLIDIYFKLYYQELEKSKDETLSALATKSLKEVSYHLRHSGNWVIRLGDGTQESKDKIQKSLNNIWKYTGEFFEMDELDKKMLKEKIGVNNKNLKKDWDKLVDETLIKAKLKRPEDGYMMTGSRKGIHTEMLGKILSEMQYLPRAYPDAKW